MLTLVVIGVALFIGYAGYSLFQGKHTKLGESEFNMPDKTIETTHNDKIKIDTSSTVKPLDHSKQIPKKPERPYKNKIYSQKHFLRPVDTTNIQGKNVLKGNVSGGNVIVGDNGTINQREQRILSDKDKLKLVKKLDSLIFFDYLTSNIRITVSFPMSSEEAQRFAMNIGHYLHLEGYNVTSVGPSMGNENLGFIVRFIDNAIQVEVGLKDMGLNKF